LNRRIWPGFVRRFGDLFIVSPLLNLEKPVKILLPYPPKTSAGQFDGDELAVPNPINNCPAIDLKGRSNLANRVVVFHFVAVLTYLLIPIYTLIYHIGPCVKHFLPEGMGFDRILSTMTDDIFMTRAELMEYLKIRRTTLQRLMNRKEFPWFKLDRRILFKKSDIDKWLESKRIS